MTSLSPHTYMDGAWTHTYMGWAVTDPGVGGSGTVLTDSLAQGGSKSETTIKGGEKI